MRYRFLAVCWVGSSSIPFMFFEAVSVLVALLALVHPNDPKLKVRMNKLSIRSVDRFIGSGVGFYRLDIVGLFYS